MLISGTPTTPGTYTITASVTVSSSAGPVPGSGTWLLTVNPASTTGIKVETLLPSLILAPNPATSELNLFAAFHVGKVQIIDALGKIVISHEANYSTETSIDIHNLSKGVYFLQANDGNKLITKKFIKE